MQTPELEELGHPIIGDSLAFNFQATGANNRVISRSYRCPARDLHKHIVALENPTLRDPQFPAAVIVDQSGTPQGSSDAILRRVFAEVPTEWNDYDDMHVEFPGVQRIAMGEREMLWRNSPISLQSVVRINRRYFLGMPQRIPKVPKFSAVDLAGIRVSSLTPSTAPSNEEYAAMVLAGQELCVSCRILRWKGDIWCRETIYAKAQ